MKIEPVGEIREFEPGAVKAAAEYIETMPTYVRHVYIDVQDPDGKWVFVYGNERSFVVRLLEHITYGRRFRVREPYIAKKGVGGS